MKSNVVPDVLRSPAGSNAVSVFTAMPTNSSHNGTLLSHILNRSLAKSTCQNLLQKQRLKKVPDECREQQFELQAKYSDDSPIPESFDQEIGRFMLGPPKSASAGDKAKLKVMLPSLVSLHLLAKCLDGNGMCTASAVSRSMFIANPHSCCPSASGHANAFAYANY